MLVEEGAVCNNMFTHRSIRLSVRQGHFTSGKWGQPDNPARANALFLIIELIQLQRSVARGGGGIDQRANFDPAYNYCYRNSNYRREIKKET